MTDTSPPGAGSARELLERRLAGLSPAKRALLLKQAGFAPAAAADTGIPRATATGPAPLSFGQELLWLVEQATSGTAAYNVPSGLRMRGTFDERAFRRAVETIVARHEVLRSRFPVVDGRPVQIVDEHARPEIDTADFRALPAEKRPDAANAWLHDIARSPFDLTTEIPIRLAIATLADDEHWILFSLHHLVSDGWSRGVMYGELTTLYNAFAAGRDPGLAPLQIQYRDFAIWQREQLQGAQLERLLAFWRGQLAEGSDQVTLPYDFTRPRTPSFEGARSATVLPLEVQEGVKALGRQHNASVFVTLLAAFQAFFYRYTAAQDIVIASPVAGRSQPELAPLIGYFGNTLLFRATLDAATTFRALVTSGRETALAAFEHQELPFERLILDLPPERRMSTAPLFHAMFSLDTGTNVLGTFDGLEVTPVGGGIGVAKTDLCFFALESDEGLRLGAEYRTDLFRPSTIDRMLVHFGAFLADAVVRPDVPVSQLAIMPESERRTILHDWNATATAYPRDAFVHELFAAEAARRPNAVAVECGSAVLSYAELDAQSNAVARRLLAEDVAEGERVGVFAERSTAAVIATLGILKAGAVFVPLEPTYPADRLNFMVSDARVRLVLAQQHLIAKYPQVAGIAPPRMIDIEELARGDPARLAPRASTTDPGTRGAYVMYTSGSTGRPKGVVVPHRGIVRLVRNTNYTVYSDATVMLGIAPSAFDAATLEYWPPLLNGGRLVFLPPGPLDLDAIADLVEQRSITTMWLTAALFNQVVELGLERYASARLIMTGGDVLSVPHVRRALEALPNCVILNGYGPTENTVFTTCFTIPRDWPKDAVLPIGLPVSNTRVFVLDANKHPVPIGVTGEIYAGGDGLALGYLDRPELNAERFVADPFSGETGARMYKTGDFGRWGAEGMVWFIGRTDTQVKVRGFRVEPGEVEAVLGAHPAVRQAAVIARKTPKGDVQLVGYYADQATDGTTSPAAMRTYLKERVPDHMLPAALIRMDALPIGPTGKLNRAALPAPDLSATESSGRMGPRNNVEAQLHGIWEGVLETRPIGYEQDFFELGGHSLLAVRMLAEVERVSGRKIPLTTLFQHASIEALAEVIENDVFSGEEPPATVLQADGEARPFAFVHGDVHGGGWYCRRLAPMIGTNVPFVVLPTLRPSTAGNAASIEAMAARHVAELRRLQPKGPYRVGGFCVGGAIAFEMACQLREQGHEVERVVLVDASAGNFGFATARVLLDAIAGDGHDATTVERRASIIRQLHYYRGRWKTVNRGDTASRWRWVRDNVKRRLPFVGSGRSERPVPATIYAAPENGDEGPGMEVVRFQDLAAGAYIPRRYDGAIDVVFSVNVSKHQIGPDVPPSPTESLEVRQSRSRWLNWERVAKHVRAYGIPSTHLELATRNLPALGDVLHDILKE